MDQPRRNNAIARQLTVKYLLTLGLLGGTALVNYVILRTQIAASRSVDEVVNLSGQAIADYTLTLAKGPFTAAHAPAWLLGEGDIYLPPVNADGGFGAYRPIPVLPPNSSLVIQYMP